MRRVDTEQKALKQEARATKKADAKKLDAPRPGTKWLDEFSIDAKRGAIEKAKEQREAKQRLAQEMKEEKKRVAQEMKEEKKRVAEEMKEEKKRVAEEKTKEGHPGGEQSAAAGAARALGERPGSLSSR
jgi:hypothetical protein